jgi:methionyl-tRNA formyltransferase
MPDRPAGRGQSLHSPEVISYAKANKINFFQTENLNKEEEFLSKIKNEEIDLIIVLAFAQFLSEPILKLPRIGCFNIHTSLLPKYRGAAPIQYAILNGDNETGVSIQKMVKKMDAGELVKESKIKISSDETGGQLYTRLKYQAALCLNDFIIDILNDSVSYRAQDENNVSFAPTLKRDDGHIQFEAQNFEDIRNRVRALYPWPGTFCYLNKKRLKIYNIEKSEDNLNPGDAKIIDNKLIVGSKSCALRITDLQLEGKKRCSDSELINGLRDKEINLE